MHYCLDRRKSKRGYVGLRVRDKQSNRGNNSAMVRFPIAGKPRYEAATETWSVVKDGS